MTKDQCAIGQALLNSYAHQFHDLGIGDVTIAGFLMKEGGWQLAVVCAKTKRNELCATFDEAKAVIDSLLPEGRRLI